MHHVQLSMLLDQSILKHASSILDLSAFSHSHEKVNKSILFYHSAILQRKKKKKKSGKTEHFIQNAGTE